LDLLVFELYDIGSIANWLLIHMSVSAFLMYAPADKYLSAKLEFFGCFIYVFCSILMLILSAFGLLELSKFTAILGAITFICLDLFLHKKTQKFNEKVVVIIGLLRLFFGCVGFIVVMYVMINRTWTWPL